ncbi:MAG TPA: trypsin-like peptidase domain-containing protein [Candidatus Obscuribacterales bacterium]
MNEPTPKAPGLFNRGAQIVLSGLIAGMLVIGYFQLSHQPPPVQDGKGPIEQLTNAPAAAASVPTGASEQQIINLYKTNSDSVVNVTTRSLGYNQYMELVPRAGAGSGFVIDKQGHVVTNYHVVEGAQRFFVAFGNVEQSYPAKLVGFDKDNDLAVLQVQAPAGLLNPVQLGDSTNLQVGQTAIAIGNPFALGQTITTGVVSSLNRSLQVENGRVISGLIQTDAAINQGNSGGPLFDSSGRVIGVNTLIYSPSGGSVGIGFAIPISTVKRFVPDLIQFGRARHPYLGVAVLPLSPRLSQMLNLQTDHGLMVIQVQPGGPAEAAGIRGGSRTVTVGNYEIALGGDVLLSVDGRPLNNENELINYLQSQKQVGETLKVRLWRPGKGEMDLEVPLTAVRE